MADRRNVITLDMGGTIPVFRLREMTDTTDMAAIVRGLEAARVVLDFEGFQREVDALDNVVHADVQTDLRLLAAQASGLVRDVHAERHVAGTCGRHPRPAQ